MLYGTISVQQTLPFGTAQQVKDEIASRIEGCGSDGGLILAPSNVVQEDVPYENILAMYNVN